MNRKTVRGRSSLSFATTSGILDVEEIMESDPWKKIESFNNGEAASIQNVLDEFKDQLELKEKGGVKGKLKNGAKKPAARQNGEKRVPNPRRSQTGDARKSKKAIKAKDEQKDVNDIPKKKRSAKGKNPQEPKTADEDEMKVKADKASNLSAKSDRKLNRAATIEKREEDVTDWRQSDFELKTSTPVRKSSESVCSTNGEISVKKQAKKTRPSTSMEESSSRKYKLEKCSPVKDVSDIDIPSFDGAEKNASVNEKNRSVETSKRIEESTVKSACCKLQLKITEKTSKHGKMKGNSKKHVDPKPQKSKCKKGSKEYEKRQLERKETRKKKMLNRCNKKLARAMEKFSHEVVNAAKSMGYLPKGCSDSEDDPSDYSRESSHSSSVYSSDSSSSYYCSCSCGSSSSCSCCWSSTSGTEYSEYTLCSCSDCQFESCSSSSSDDSSD